MADLLDPKNDYVFKRLFTAAPDLLVSLINAVRTTEVPISDVEILNPRIEPEELTGKFIVLDLLAKDIEGRQYNIEMQVRNYPNWGARSLYYLASLLSNQLKSGNGYKELKPAIGIHLLDYDYFKGQGQQNQALWCFDPRDRQRPDVRLGNELQLNIVELPKADRLGLKDPALAPLVAWVTTLEHWQEESKMAEIAYPPVQRAMGILKTLSADEEARRLAQVRERALINERIELNAARREGKAEAMQEALAKLIENGMDEAEAKRILGL